MSHADKKVLETIECSHLKTQSALPVCPSAPSPSARMAQEPGFGSAPLIIVMAKDPAFLFYFQDFLVGTEFMSAQDVGCYIRILCHMADKGRLSEKHLLSICRETPFSDCLRSKFKIDSEGYFFNERLSFEVLKRKSFCESRRLSRSFRTSNVRNTYVERMENEDVNENANKDIKEIEVGFDEFWRSYPRKVGKIKALDSWNKIAPKKDLTKKILLAVSIQDQWPQWKKDGGQFIPHPATWLNQGRWDDEHNDTTCKKCYGRGKFVSKTGYEILCDCEAAKGKI